MRDRTMVSLSIVFLWLAIAIPRADARCATRDLALEVMTPLDRPIPAGGAIVLALRPTARGSGSAIGPSSATIGTPGMGEGGLTMVETIAPGLYRVPLGGTPPGPHTLRGVFATELSFTVSSAPLVTPPAPDLLGVTIGPRGRGGANATARLGAPAPATAIGIVIYTSDGAISYVPIRDRSAPSLVGFGRCDPWPDGASPPSSGASIALRYLDATGQLSPLSRAVTASP